MENRVYPSVLHHNTDDDGHIVLSGVFTAHDLKGMLHIALNGLLRITNQDPEVAHYLASQTIVEVMHAGRVSATDISEALDIDLTDIDQMLLERVESLND